MLQKKKSQILWILGGNSSRTERMLGEIWIWGTKWTGGISNCGKCSPTLYSAIKLVYSFSFFMDTKADIKKQIPPTNKRVGKAIDKDIDNLRSKLIKEEIIIRIEAIKLIIYLFFTVFSPLPNAISNYE